MNFVTPHVMRLAACTVTEGRSLSLAWDIDPAVPDVRGAPERLMLQTGQGNRDRDRIKGDGGPRMAEASERITMAFHGLTITHLDALSHCFWDYKMYEGALASLVDESVGAAVHDARSSRNGVATRAVLIDAAGLSGERWLEPGTSVTKEDVEALEIKQRVKIRPGDVVLLRTGAGRRRHELGPADPAEGYPGWDPSCLTLFAEREVAIVGADTPNDAMPNPYEEFGIAMPVHVTALTAMGVRLIDNCDLEAAAEACASLGRYAFFITISTLRLVGCTGSPVNPIAHF